MKIRNTFCTNFPGLRKCNNSFVVIRTNIATTTYPVMRIYVFASVNNVINCDQLSRFELAMFHILEFFVSHFHFLKPVLLYNRMEYVMVLGDIIFDIHRPSHYYQVDLCNILLNHTANIHLVVLLLLAIINHDG